MAPLAVYETMKDRVEKQMLRMMLLTLAVAMAAPALVACGKKPPPGPMPLSVDAAAATRQTIATYITLDGQISPSTSQPSPFSRAARSRRSP